MWTDKHIKGLTAKEKLYRVTDQLGQKGSGKLVLEIEPNGSKSFFYQQYIKTEKGSRRQLIKIGRYRDRAKATGVTLSEAREKALEYAKLTQKHGDLKAYLIEQEELQHTARRQRDSANISVQDALDAYFDHKDLKPGTVKDYRRAIKETFGAHLNTPLASITREKILSLYRQRASVSPSRANNAMRVFKAVYNFTRAISRSNDGQHLLPENPTNVLGEAKVIKKIQRRKSYIPREELKTWFEGVLSLDSDKFPSGPVLCDYYIFLLLTGVRREEARQLKREDINLARGVFRLTDTKNRETIELPMSTPLIGLMRSRLASHRNSYVFSLNHEDKPFGSFKRPQLYLREERGLNFSAHDLRRTFITVAESLDISGYTIKKLVNHKLSDSADVTAGYMVIDIDRMRAASEKITEKMLEFGEPHCPLPV